MKAMTRRKIRLVARFFCFLSVAVYALSFFLPSFEIVVEGKPEVSYGFHAFFIGLFSPFSPFFGGFWGVFVPWLANPMFIVGITLFAKGRPRGALLSAVIATGLSAALLALSDPAGLHLILIGYYVWVASMGILALAVGMDVTLTALSKPRRSFDHERTVA